MKRIPYIYIILWPYVTYLTLNLILEKFSMNQQGIIMMLVAVAVYSLIAAGAMISGMVISTFKLSVKEASIWNLIIKLLHLPAHTACFLLFCGMMNPFLMLLSWLPAIASIPLQFVSATTNVGTCINCRKNKKMETKTAVIFALLSYLYIIDIIIAVIQVVLICRKKEATSD